MVLNVVLRLVPTKVNAAMAATAINAAINAYSMAVTPDWSLVKFEKNVRNLSIPSVYLKYTYKLQSKALRNQKEPETLPCCAAGTGALRTPRASR